MNETKGDLAVDVHWCLPPGNKNTQTPDIRWLWEHTGKSDIYELDLDSKFILKPHAHFLYLCGHLILQNAPDRRCLSQVLDLYFLWKKFDIPSFWDDLSTQASSWGWEGVLASALILMEDVFDIDFSSQIEDWIEAAPRAENIPAEVYIRKAWNQLPGNVRWRALWHNIFPSRGYLERFFGDKAHLPWFLLHFFRWFEILKRWEKNRVAD